MNLEKLFSWISRLFFLGGFVLLGLAILERGANQFGYTFEPAYRSGRLLEFAAVLMIFVIAIQVRELKEAYKGKRT